MQVDACRASCRPHIAEFRMRRHFIAYLDVNRREMRIDRLIAILMVNDDAVAECAGCPCFGDRAVVSRDDIECIGLRNVDAFMGTAPALPFFARHVAAVCRPGEFACADARQFLLAF